MEIANDSKGHQPRNFSNSCRPTGKRTGVLIPSGEKGSFKTTLRQGTKCALHAKSRIGAVLQGLFVILLLFRGSFQSSLLDTDDGISG